MPATIQQMLHELLSTLGFAAMARDVLTEQDYHRLQHYARVILRATPTIQKHAISSRFAMLRLI